MSQNAEVLGFFDQKFVFNKNCVIHLHKGMTNIYFQSLLTCFPST